MRWKLEHILKKGGGSILWEDVTILAINKPAGLLVLPDRYDHRLPDLYGLLKDTFGTIYVVHRIDKETSGVVLFAKTAEAHAQLNIDFEQRRIKKKYLTIVMGVPNTDAGCIDIPIIENEHGIRKMVTDTKKGRDSRTEYTVIERFVGYSFIEARPSTGRTHQIRVHLSALGLPILADPLYGDGRGFFLSSIKRNYLKKEEEQPLLRRTALHAFSLSFNHPATHENIVVEAPLPKDMEAVLKALRKHQGIEGRSELK
jgi:23S rRNA pseudouridine1911/1915/1917 synthase